jgi:hypothetical protein
MTLCEGVGGVAFVGNGQTGRHVSKVRRVAVERGLNEKGRD